ncbi:MAG: M23 family metallopeptidase [Candidatus Moduliflexus flocculans]|nr:M23 family metallopeptidase [Candidatus Moduliflexus flocculans]
MSGLRFFRTDPLERLDGRRTFAAVSSILIFASLFLGSRNPARVRPVRRFRGHADPRPGVSRGGCPGEAPPRDEGLWYQVYVVKKGDIPGLIAEAFGVTVDTLVSFNDIRNTRAIAIGARLKIPNMNGILHEAASGETVESVAARYSISPERVAEVNRLSSGELREGRKLFLPDARLSSFALREINGDLFKWPLRGWITSWYGWRNDPFSGTRTFHTGLDIGAAHGAPVRAAMEGRVSTTGYNAVSGNYVIIAHHSGYASMYAHLDSIDVRKGQAVSIGTRIGTVGNTGYSTGSHLHFTVLKHGRTINPMLVLN